MVNMFFINSITNYVDVNSKGKKIQEWLSSYNRTFLFGTVEFEKFKSELVDFVFKTNLEYSRQKTLAVNIHAMDNNGNIAIYIENADRADKVVSIVYVKKISRVIGGNIKNLFTDGQLSVIRDVLADEIKRNMDFDLVYAIYLLNIINIIQENDGFPTFGSLEIFNKDTSSTWGEIVIEED